MSTKEATERAQHARTMLLQALKPGDTVYTVLRHVSTSGMQRRIDCYAIGNDRRPIFLSGYMDAIGIGKRHPKKDGLVINGCGMDMGFHLVNSLSIALFCPNEYTKEGANALNHKWL